VKATITSHRLVVLDGAEGLQPTFHAAARRPCVHEEIARTYQKV
jgi:hypothetical protein